MEAIIDQGVDALDFLLSPMELDPSLSVEKARILLLDNPPVPYRQLINTKLILVLETVYKNHLYAVRDKMGLNTSRRDREEYAKAHHRYHKDLTTAITDWGQARKLDFRTGSRTQILHNTIDGMENKLDWILVKGLFHTVSFGLVFDYAPPLLCQMFLVDFSLPLIDLGGWIRIIWSILDPFAISASAISYYRGATPTLLHAIERYAPKIQAHLVLREVCLVVLFFFFFESTLT